MRLDKSQVNPLIKLVGPTGGSSALGSNFKRDIFVMAGYTDYAYVCVGGAGGRSGRSTGNSSSIGYEMGGGGGGSLFGKGKLLTLPAGFTIIAGQSGSPGADKGNGVPGGQGAYGGSSMFMDEWAYGGGGGQGSIVHIMGGGASWSLGTGGEGGGNSLDYGTGGEGGGWQTYQEAGAAKAGTGVLVDGVGGSVGGGGGQGRLKISGDNEYSAGDGYEGALGVVDMQTGKEPDDGNQGGHGGGVNIKPILGVNEFWGSHQPGSNPQGLVCIKMT